MKIREQSLPRGWYPGNADAIISFLNNYSGGNGKQNSIAAIAPHAGWYFSGVTAAISFSALDKNADTIAVIGGHLPSGYPVLYGEEEGFKTPLGIIESDMELLDKISEKLTMASDRFKDNRVDNTVEVLLPMAKYFFPKAKLLWFRFPADIASFHSGKIIAECAKGLGRRIVVVGSTDLTHYGANYGFSPEGSGQKALNWVKEINDARFIKAVLDDDPAAVLDRADKEMSSCSAGAVLGAMGFASSSAPPAKPELLDYRTSADARDACQQNAEGIPDSFVGYASIVF